LRAPERAVPIAVFDRLPPRATEPTSLAQGTGVIADPQGFARGGPLYGALARATEISHEREGLILAPRADIWLIDLARGARPEEVPIYNAALRAEAARLTVISAFL
jgi:hypothetical protein